MSPRRVLAVLGLVVLLVPALAHAQGSTVTIETSATSQGQPLADASPIPPGESILVHANVTSSGDTTAEYRAFLNATLDGQGAGSAERNWTGEDAVRLPIELRAPSETGSHDLAWEITVQSRSGADQPWTTEDTRQETRTFRVEERPPPDPATIDIQASATVNGTALGETSDVQPGQSIILAGSVTVPDRNQTQWRVYFNASVDGNQTVSRRLLQTGGGTMNLSAQTTAPNEPGAHELTWTVTVQYRESSDPDATWSTAETADETSSFQVEELSVPPGPGLPWAWIIGIGAVVLGGGAGVYWWRTRDRQIRGQARSQAMRELEGESFEEETVDEPEVHPQLKILQARADDVRRMIELAKERHESGDLTEHQFETIRERKEQELEEIEAEMEEYREQS